MAKDQPWKAKGLKKDEWLAQEVAKAIGAGKPWACETVDFSDPDRPPTCIEVDFPIVPVNEPAEIEASSGAATKPIYQMSRWWARRQASVFRSILLASVIKAPDDPAEAAKLVWDAYYGNHQKKGAFKHLKVADIFMGGGTTIVEGSRLGMQMFGNDLNPVAWFIVKNALAQVDKAEVEALLADIEAEVKPQIMPFYACDCPRGHKGQWTRVSTGEVMGDDFDPLALTPDERKDYSYHGPEIIYAFWAKHGPCQVTGCGHRTPIMSSPVMAIKTLTVKAWSRTCKHCGAKYDLEQRDARMAPGVPLVVADTELPFAVAELGDDAMPERATCPCCGATERFGKLGAGRRKKVELSLLVHPQWLQGEASHDPEGRPYGGSANDPVEATIRWNEVRAEKCKLIEVRGKLPEVVECPETGGHIRTGKEGGNVHQQSSFACQACGGNQDVLTSVKSYGRTAPFAEHAYQVYCPVCEGNGELQGGRAYMQASEPKNINAAIQEWSERSVGDLQGYWPDALLSEGWKTHGWAIPEHGYTHYCLMFNPRQLLQHAVLLRAIAANNSVSPNATESVLGAFAQFLRYSSLFTIWHLKNNQISAFLSNNNFQLKNAVVETKAFSPVGDGSFLSAGRRVLQSCDYRGHSWDLVLLDSLTQRGASTLLEHLSGKTCKVYPGDAVLRPSLLECTSSSNLDGIASDMIDVIVTDPPFGELMQYAELSDFFYVWLRLLLKDVYPEQFSPPYSPKALEAVTNPFRNVEPEAFYQQMLTACWREAARVLKPGGLLVFTFHHDNDGPWIMVLESLFKAGFVVIRTFPIRGDASRGDENSAYGAEKVEYDIIHVCRKRQGEPKRISWARLRRLVLQDVRDLQALLEHHQQEGLPEADLQVIRRGKALEYFSRHYGQVYKDQVTPMSVAEGLVGINQLLDEESGGIKEAPPHNAEPFTRMLLRLFDGSAELPRDQMQKFLRGTGSAPSDYVDRGWVYEEKKVFYLTPPLELARSWVGKHRKGLQSDYDQAIFLVGACVEGSGINVNDTLNNPSFRPHPALGALLTWLKTHGADTQARTAASRASSLFAAWAARNQSTMRQLDLFDQLDEEAA
ncbi:hypothetical protein [Thiohalocapsa sp. ML1]|uniref:hypothetical protein n=1 Tax=Thiohalocapsa sp. ML1 TaxID=1431688 RepID=UPI0007320411|nr:hypothetical protein [Thiohalocapsa sp. ML1]